MSREQSRLDMREKTDGNLLFQEWVPGSHTSVTRWEEYPGSIVPYFENKGKAYLDGIRWEAILEGAQRAVRIENGEIDTLRNPLLQDVARLEQNPDLGATWTICDFCVPLMAQTVNAKQGGDRKTVVGGMYSNPESIADIRKGEVDGIADYAWALPVWVGMDQALNKWVNDKDPVQGSAVYGTYPLPFMKPYMITKANALASGPAPIYGPDYETFFKAKWAKEYGVTP